MLIAIDPGGERKGCSAALFDDQGRLTQVFPEIRSAWRLTRVVVERPQQDGRSKAVPDKILMDLAWQGALLAGQFVALGAELRAYAPDDWKGGVREDGRYISGMPKAQHHANMVESGALTAPEMNVIDTSNWHAEVFAARRKGALCRWAPSSNGHYPSRSRLPDVLDAVGLGLFDLGRITKDGHKK